MLHEVFSYKSVIEGHDKRNMELANTIVKTYVTGYGKTDHFAHYFKIELLVFKDSVDLKL